MLKVEYPSREFFPSYQNPTKPNITWIEAKKHLHDIRLRRQNHLTNNINECLKLCNIHQQVYNGQQNSKNSIEKCPENKSNRSIHNEYSLSIKKYSIPRVEYAPIIYRQAIPTFEIDQSSLLEKDVPPIVKQLTEYVINDSSCAISNDKKQENHQSSSIKIDQGRRLSVSSVSSQDKRANKIYEKWPDYDHISELVGYRIDPPQPAPPPPTQPPAKTSKSNSISSRPSDANIQRKQNKTAGFSTTSKQIKNMMNLNPSPTRRESLKNKKSTTTDTPPTPALIDQPSPPPLMTPVLLNTPIKEIKPKLPDYLCPSSIAYSNRIRTRQWLIKNTFSSNGMRTLPLI